MVRPRPNLLPGHALEDGLLCWRQALRLLLPLENHGQLLHLFHGVAGEAGEPGHGVVVLWRVLVAGVIGQELVGNRGADLLALLLILGRLGYVELLQ